MSLYVTHQKCNSCWPACFLVLCVAYLHWCLGWETAFWRSGLACWWWRPAPTPQHQSRDYTASCSSCGLDQCAPDTPLQKPSQRFLPPTAVHFRPHIKIKFMNLPLGGYKLALWILTISMHCTIKSSTVQKTCNYWLTSAVCFWFCCISQRKS